MTDGPVILYNLGEPSSRRSFGDVTDPTSNGKAPGGVAVDATNPVGERQAAIAGRIDPKGLVSLRTSPTSWVLLAVVVFVYLNAKARRAGRR